MSYGSCQPSPYPGRRLLRATNLSKKPTLFAISLEERSPRYWPTLPCTESKTYSMNGRWSAENDSSAKPWKHSPRRRKATGNVAQKTQSTVSVDRPSPEKRRAASRQRFTDLILMEAGEPCAWSQTTNALERIRHSARIGDSAIYG